MKLTLSLSLLVAGALVSPAAFPCGAPFGTGINVDPKQDIVVVHKNGMETYVFQPRFCGTAREFGLILPIPAKLSSAPALSKATVFTKVVALSEPEYRTQTICGSGGMKGGSTGAAGGSGSNGGPTVVSSGTVGFMDYTQLKADTTASFTDWLDTNGYPYDTLAKDSFSYYVDKGWYLLAFKISQGVVPSGSSVCKDLGPVKLSFPSELPVVPTRMATARNRDASGALSYASNFSWRIFGITEAAKQIYFTNGFTSRQTLGYSGLLQAEDIALLDGLAVTGDRLDKLNLTFDYGSKDPDVELSLVGGTDYREYVTSYRYVTCPEAGVPDAPTVRADTASARDATVASPDTLSTQVKDAEPLRPDSESKLDIAHEIPVERDAGLAPDSAVAKPMQGDAGVSVSATADAARPTPTDEPSEKKSSGGCSLAFGSTEHGLGALLVLGLALALRRRR